MRKPIVAGNWKMNKDAEESASFIKKIAPMLSKKKDVDILLCPPSTSLYTVCSLVNGTNILVGAQNFFWEEKGAYTGEISPVMVKNIGCAYVITGHSERRQYFFETDENVNKKVKAAINHGLRAIVCVGETLKEKDDGITHDILTRQIQNGLKDIDKKDMGLLHIAYEPIWAIGTGRTASPSQANEAHQFIRERLVRLFDKDIASSIRILYGGSVKPENMRGLIEKSDIDGVLVGGASLDADSFVKLVESC